jgi:hypothetical protein
MASRHPVPPALSPTTMWPSSTRLNYPASRVPDGGEPYPLQWPHDTAARSVQLGLAATMEPAPWCPRFLSKREADRPGSDNH